VKAQAMLDGVGIWADHIGLKVITGMTKFMAVNDTYPFSLIEFKTSWIRLTVSHFLAPSFVLMDFQTPISNSDCKKHNWSLFTSKNHCGTG